VPPNNLQREPAVELEDGESAVFTFTASTHQADPWLPGGWLLSIGGRESAAGTAFLFNVDFHGRDGLPGGQFSQRWNGAFLPTFVESKATGEVRSAARIYVPLPFVAVSVTGVDPAGGAAKGFAQINGLWTTDRCVPRGARRYLSNWQNVEVPNGGSIETTVPAGASAWRLAPATADGDLVVASIQDPNTGTVIGVWTVDLDVNTPGAVAFPWVALPVGRSELEISLKHAVADTRAWTLEFRFDFMESAE
jgi:hypothetical protein